MKRKIFKLLLAIITASFCAVGFTACTDSSGSLVKFTYQVNDNGTYTVTGIKSTPAGEFVIEIPSTCNNVSVTEIAYKAFSGVEGATGVIIPESVTRIGWEAFYICKDLKTIKLPDGLTSIGTQAFFGTAYYNDGSNWDNEVLYIGNHLIEAKATITGSYNINDGTRCIAQDAFYDCTGLTGVTIPAGVTSIGISAFSGCTGLTSVTIPAGVTSIGESAFSGCTGLTSVTILDGVTSIDRMTFNKCSGLTSISIPNSVTYIGNGAFSSGLDIYYSGTTAEWNSIEKDSTWITSHNYTIHCSDGDISR